MINRNDIIHDSEKTLNKLHFLLNRPHSVVPKHEKV